MTENSDSVVLVDDAEPPGRNSFRVVQNRKKTDGHTNEALDVENIDVTNASTLPPKVSISQGIDHHSGVSATTPVYYATKQGPTITQEQVVIGSTAGGAVIRTPETPQSEERPLKSRDIRFLIAFSILGLFCLLPVGIAAVYFAFKTKYEYAKGMQTANMTKAKKLARRTEHLIIFSFIGGMVVIAIIFAVIERYIWAHDSEYWDHRLHTVRGAIP